MGWDAQSLRQTCPSARWREDCKGGQEEKAAAGRLVCPADAWAAQQAEPQVCRQGLDTWGTRVWMHTRGRYWGWGQV